MGDIEGPSLDRDPPCASSSLASQRPTQAADSATHRCPHPEGQFAHREGSNHRLTHPRSLGPGSLILSSHILIFLSVLVLGLSSSVCMSLSSCPSLSLANSSLASHLFLSLTCSPWIPCLCWTSTCFLSFQLEVLPQTLCSTAWVYQSRSNSDHSH